MRLHHTAWLAVGLLLAASIGLAQDVPKMQAPQAPQGLELPDTGGGDWKEQAADQSRRARLLESHNRTLSIRIDGPKPLGSPEVLWRRFELFTRSRVDLEVTTQPKNQVNILAQVEVIVFDSRGDQVGARQVEVSKSWRFPKDLDPGKYAIAIVRKAAGPAGFKLHLRLTPDDENGAERDDRWAPVPLDAGKPAVSSDVSLPLGDRDDWYGFSIEDRVDVTLRLEGSADQLAGELLRGEERLATLEPKLRLRRELEAGDYLVHVGALGRPVHKVPYTLGLQVGEKQVTPSNCGPDGELAEAPRPRVWSEGHFIIDGDLGPTEHCFELDVADEGRLTIALRSATRGSSPPRVRLDARGAQVREAEQGRVRNEWTYEVQPGPHVITFAAPDQGQGGSYNLRHRLCVDLGKDPPKVVYARGTDLLVALPASSQVRRGTTGVVLVGDEGEKASRIRVEVQAVDGDRAWLTASEPLGTDAVAVRLRQSDCSWDGD